MPFAVRFRNLRKSFPQLGLFRRLDRLTDAPVDGGGDLLVGVPEELAGVLELHLAGGFRAGVAELEIAKAGGQVLCSVLGSVLLPLFANQLGKLGGHFIRCVINAPPATGTTSSVPVPVLLIFRSLSVCGKAGISGSSIPTFFPELTSFV
jgi:hypothetical protein